MPQPAYYICSFIFQVLTFAAVVVGVVALWLQRSALKRQYLAQREALRRIVMPALIQHLESPSACAARRLVRGELCDKPSVEWTADQQAAASEALAAFDIAGALARHDQVHKDVILDHWAHEIVAVCRVCREFLAERRAKEGRGYMRSLLWLESEANQALADEFT